MDAIEFTRHQIADLYHQVDAVLKDTTDDHLNWVGPGTVNTIGAILVHMFSTEDFYLQTLLGGQLRIWEAEGWGRKVGLETPPARGRGWEEVKQAKFTLAPLLEYMREVRVATEAYLAQLTPGELDREVPFFGEQQPVADVLTTLIVHIAAHAGEVAALKGVQGVKGLPF